MIPDKLLINMRILGKIQKNGRVSKSHNGVLSLEQDSSLQGVKRYMYSDSRHQTLFEVNSIVSDITNFLESIYNSRYMTIEASKQEHFYITLEDLRMMIAETALVQVGVTNLQFTYIKDVNVSTQLDIVLIRLRGVIREAKARCAGYESWL